MPEILLRGGDAAYTLRTATEGDIAQVAAIDVSITGIEKPGYWEDIHDRYVRQPAEDAGLAHLNRLFLCACQGETVIGFIVGEIRAWEFGSPPCGWVFAIGVRRDLRTRHVAQTLFQAACDSFRAAGISIIRTMLARDNTLAMSFFRSQGMMAGPFIQLEMELQPS